MARLSLTRRRATRVAVVYVVVAAALTAAVALWPTAAVEGQAPRRLAPLTGRVLDLQGRPLARARVRVTSRWVRVDREGGFTSRPLPGAAWVRAEAPGRLPLVLAVAPGRSTDFRLARDDGRTDVLNFVGDVMFGRRFFDRNEDGALGDGLLRPGDSVAAHLRLFRHVRPLLSAADVTVVNLETPLIERPYFHPGQQRPARFHPTKEFAFASSPGAAAALRHAGVDVVGLGNNHLYDARQEGVDQTLAALDAVGFLRGRGRTGGGRDEAEAVQPAVVPGRTGALAFVACTTIDRPLDGATGGPQFEYVARGREKGGAARCDGRALAATVRGLRRQGATVTVMIHGGYEYEPTPSPNIRRLTAAARSAGAALVINHHPHVVGGLDWDGRSLVAWTLGNFLFDQTIWPTFKSYLLRVELRGGRISRALAIPLRVDGYVPKGIAGPTAARVAGEAAARSRGPAVVRGDVLELLPSARSATRARIVRLGERTSGAIYRADPNALAQLVRGKLEVGRDLLWVGGFEDDDVDPRAQTPLWSLSGPDELAGSRFAREGEAGLRLRRDSTNCSDAYVSPIHRLLVRRRAPLTIVGSVRATGAAGVQLSWYPDTKGPSRLRRYYPLPGRSATWERFRIDVDPPPWAVALTPYMRLAPTPGSSTFADWDEVAVVQWSSAPRGGAFAEYYRATPGASVRISRRTFAPEHPLAPPSPTLLAASPARPAPQPARPPSC